MGPHLTLPLYTPMSNFKLHLYLLSTTPFYIPSLHTQHCRILYDYPPLTLPFCTLTLNFILTSSLHPLSTSTLYIFSIVGYCHGTAQSPLGSPPVTRQQRRQQQQHQQQQPTTT